MITKLTAENSGLYYAPVFELINQALETAGNPLRIHSIEDYFNNLTSDIIPLLVNQHQDSEGNMTGIRGGYLLLMPADEEIFEIDANTRIISIPDNVKKNGIGVYGDHNAEMIVLNIDRYFDNQDLLNTNVAINWNFTPMGAKTPIFDEPHAVPAFAPNADLNPEKVTFGFIIDKNMTKKGRGTLTFSVTFYTDNSGVIDYSLNTLTASVVINDTLTLTDPSIIRDEIDNYLNRFTNSVYQDNTVSLVGNPVWKSGDKDENGNYTGLEKVAYFAPEEDLRNVYGQGVLLTAYAIVNPATADVTYKWTESPLNSNVAMGRDFNTINLSSDYIEVQLPAENNGEYYYFKNESGQIDTKNVLTWAEAKAKLDEYGQDDSVPYLPLKVTKLINTIDFDESETTEQSQENQDNIIVDVHGNIVKMVSLDELNTFVSPNPDEGEAKWVALDIDTGLETIVGITWNGYPLDANDVIKATSAGLPVGHILFWAKVNSLQVVPITITLTKEGYKDTQFSLYYDGIDPTANADNINSIVVDNTDRPRFVIRGSSYRALAAGNYQVSAQARISVGEHYEKVLDTSNLKVNTNYYLKDENGNIDKLNPVTNELASVMAESGKELYICTSAARNSAVVESSVLTIPPAVQPEVSLEVGSEYEFDADGGTIIRQEDYEGPKYVYLDDTQMPTLIATVTIPSEHIEDRQGAFNAELIKTDLEGKVTQITKEDIENGSYTFNRLPADGKFIFTPEEGEGTYLTRVINRRNGTYSISDTENAQTITTSFVAPEDRNLTVTGAIWDLDNEDRPTTGYQTVLVNGDRPIVDGQRVLVNLEINRLHPRYTFNIVDNTRIDNTKYKVEDIVTKYYVEEVEYDIVHDIITARIPDSNGNIPGTNVPYEYYGEEDLREIVMDINGNLTFEINNDPGYYRIKTITFYHGTCHTSYTDIFGIATH